LKEQEAKTLNIEWDLRRFLTKVNYRIQTDAIKDILIPSSNLSSDQEGVIYANEAELLNLAVFGTTSKEWTKKNPEKVLEGLTIRDVADTIQLTVLANLQTHNADLIRQGMSIKDRLRKLQELAISQLKSLRQIDYTYSVQGPRAKK